MVGKAVLRASRPKFLLLAPLCVALGIVLTARQMVPMDSLNLVLVLLGALSAHAAVNLLNEYQDFRSGLDLLTHPTPFSGGSGALPQTPAAAPAVLGAALVALTLVAAIGVHFLLLRGWPMLLPGFAGLALVVGYTRWITRLPWLCLLAPGLGFGPVIVLGTQLALGGQPDTATLLTALIVGLLTSELLLINQIPDIEADRQSGRRHLPIVLGLKAAGRLTAALLLGAYLLLGLGLYLQLLPPAAALAMLPLPGAIQVVRQLPRALNDSVLLPRVLGINVATLLATLALLLLGLWLTGIRG